MFKEFLFQCFVVMVVSAVTSSISLGIVKLRDSAGYDTYNTIMGYIILITAIISLICFCVFMIGIVKLGLGV